MKFQHRDEIGQFLQYHGLNNIGAEIGSFRGHFAKTILSNWSGRLILVDVWRALSQEEYDDISNQKNHEDAYAECMRNLVSFEDRAFMWRMTSKQASVFVADESLDFVYIDANHLYEYVQEDLDVWHRKVRNGGLVMGHDYLPSNFYDNKTEKNQPVYLFPDGQPEKSEYAGMFGVNPAVNEFCNKHGYEFCITNEFLATWWFKK